MVAFVLYAVLDATAGLRVRITNKTRVRSDMFARGRPLPLPNLEGAAGVAFSTRAGGKCSGAQAGSIPAFERMA